VRLALQQEATSLLGADLRVASTRPLPQAYRDAARQRGLQVIETATFPSMVVYAPEGAAESRSELAEIQAVEVGYPLRGKIIINDGAPSHQPSPQSSDGTTSLNVA
jgi:putative ABC transport system permease protein